MDGAVAKAAADWTVRGTIPSTGRSAISLEIELRHNLTDTRARAWTARNSKVEQISYIRSRRSAANPKIGAIEDIEELPTNLEVDRLSNPSALDEPHVVIVGIRVSQGADVGRRIAEFKRSRDGEEVVVQPCG